MDGTAKAAVGMATTYPRQTCSTSRRRDAGSDAAAVTATSSQNGTTAAVDLPTSEAATWRMPSRSATTLLRWTSPRCA